MSLHLLVLSCIPHTLTSYYWQHYELADPKDVWTDGFDCLFAFLSVSLFMCLFICLNMLLFNYVRSLLSGSKIYISHYSRFYLIPKKLNICACLFLPHAEATDLIWMKFEMEINFCIPQKLYFILEIIWKNFWKKQFRRDVWKRRRPEGANISYKPL